MRIIVFSLLLVLSTQLFFLSPFKLVGNIVKGSVSAVVKTANHIVNPLWKAFEDGVEDEQVYRKLGLSDHEIHELKSKQKDVLSALDLYFKAFLVSPHTLQAKLKDYVAFLNRIQDKYLAEIDNLIIGANNDVKGRNNFVKANKQSVRGSDNFVVDGKHSNIPVTGDNKLRIGRYQISIDKLDRVSSNPFEVVKILSVF